MVWKKTMIIILLILCVGAGTHISAMDLEQPVVGTGMWLRFHHSQNTFALTPGASIDASLEILPDFRLGAKFISGAFFGYTTGLELGISFAPEIGPWLPEAGIATQVVFGSTVFYYHGDPGYIDVLFPEWSAGIILKPLKFSFGSFGISAMELVVGTDLLHFAQVLLVDVDLFRVFIYL